MNANLKALVKERQPLLLKESFLDSVLRIAKESAIAEGIASNKAEIIATRFVIVLRLQLGGDRAYIPSLPKRLGKLVQARRAVNLSAKGLSVREIAKVLEVTPGHVRSLLSLGRKELIFADAQPLSERGNT